MSSFDRDFGLIDEDALRDAKRVPTCELVSRLFPGHPVKKRGVFRSPFRDDRNPSFSPYLGHGGDWLWKDHATGESGDNLALYRKAFPQLSYPEAVDGLCRLVLGRPGLKDGVSVAPRRMAAPVRRDVRPAVREVEQPAAQRVLYACSLMDARVPVDFGIYWRSRGISDAVIARCCEYVCFENENSKGSRKMDADSMIPIVDDRGNAVIDDGVRFGIGLRNDIGGYALRVPDLPTGKGYKTNTSNFIATFLCDGSRPYRCAALAGNGDGAVHYVRYDAATGCVWVNPTQCFVNVRPDVIRCACAFLQGFVGERLFSREAAGVCSVLDAMAAPKAQCGTVVEGMFDALSVRELSHFQNGRPGREDLVVLNSVGNVRWAAPFLAMHDQVQIMLDNDVKSGAGQKAYVKLSEEIARYNGLFGNRTLVFNGSSIFAGYKDLNDALKAMKNSRAKASAKNASPRGVRPGEHGPGYGGNSM